MAVLYFASDYAYGINPDVEQAIVVAGPNATGAGTVTVNKATISIGSGPVAGARTFSPFNTNAPISIGTGSVNETVTPSAVSTNYPSGQALVTATFSNAHGQGAWLASGTVGLQEAINDAVTRSGGGMVVVDNRWTALGGTTAMITAAVGGSANVFIEDQRGPIVTYYGWNGSAFASSAVGFAPGLNGQGFAPFHNTELVTLSTSGLTTDSTTNLLPANSLIMMVTGYVQTTITTSTNWQLGDSVTAGRFSAVSTSLTAGSIVPTTALPPVQVGTGVASATTGMWQLAAAKVRITVTGANAGAGKIRIDTYGFTVTLPTS